MQASQVRGQLARAGWTHIVGLGNRTYILRLGSKGLYSPSPLMGSWLFFISSMLGWMWHWNSPSPLGLSVSQPGYQQIKTALPQMLEPSPFTLFQAWELGCYTIAAWPFSNPLLSFLEGSGVSTDHPEPQQFSLCPETIQLPDLSTGS